MLCESLWHVAMALALFSLPAVEPGDVVVQAWPDEKTIRDAVRMQFSVGLHERHRRGAAFDSVIPTESKLMRAMSACARDLLDQFDSSETVCIHR